MQEICLCSTICLWCSQNYLATELKRQFGINIDQKGVKYWEEHKTENPSFRKNYWEEVTNLDRIILWFA